MAHPKIDPRFPRLEVIVGCMFSGKTDELLARLDLYVHATIKTILFSPETDTRDSKTHSGREFERVYIPINPTIETLRKTMGPEEFRSIQVIGFDEGNFFNTEPFVRLCLELVALGKIVIVAGLDLTFAEEGYGAMPRLMELSDVLDKGHAVCFKCGSPYGTRTQRLIDGKPAPKNSPQNIVGDENETETSQGLVHYKPACRDCYQKPK